jgi:hypothetical protein
MSDRNPYNIDEACSDSNLLLRLTIARRQVAAVQRFIAKIPAAGA